MKPQKPVPDKYEQPIAKFVSRFMNDSFENVDYVPEYHTRIWYNNQPESYSMHHHGAMEIILVLENEYEITADGETFMLNNGDILFIAPNILHEITCSDYGVRFILLFNLDFISDFLDYKTVAPIFMHPYLCNQKTQPKIYHKIYSALMSMIDVYFSNTLMWEMTIFSLLLECFTTIGTNYFQQNTLNNKKELIDTQREHYEQFAILLDYIDKHYMEDLTLDQIADYIGFSKYHFTRLFKQHTNTTFYEYLCKRRVQAAQQLLSTTQPVTDIAFQTGFNNLTTFCRCFKKYAYCSPSEYRNRFRQET